MQGILNTRDGEERVVLKRVKARVQARIPFSNRKAPFLPLCRGTVGAVSTRKQRAGARPAQQEKFEAAQLTSSRTGYLTSLQQLMY